MGRIADSPSLPKDLDTERQTLACILLADAVLAGPALTLTPDDFTLEKHRRILQCMFALDERGERINYATVGEELKTRGWLKSVGQGYVVSLEDGMPHIVDPGSLIRILKEYTKRRRLFAVGLNLVARINAGESSAEIVAAGQEVLSDIQSNSSLGLGVTDLPALRTGDDDTIEYIRPELPKAAVVAFTGDAGSGKSTLVTAFVRDAARTENIPALILDRENPRRVVVGRFNRLGIPDELNIRVWGGWCEQEAPQPDAPGILQWVESCDPRPIIAIDSYGAFHGGDQNDAGETRRFLHRCRRLADKGATVIPIHHDGKGESSKDYRGSSDFKAAIDLGFHVSNMGETGRLGKLILRPFKQRFYTGGSIVYDYADGEFIRCEERDAERTINDKLASLLRTNPGISATEFEKLAVSDKYGVGRDRARRFLNDGLLARSIRVETRANNRKRYFLTQEPSDE